MPVPSSLNGLTNTHVVNTNRALSGTDELSKVYIRATVNQVEHYCLLDTGCDVSVFPRDVVEHRDVRPTQQPMVAANGASLELLGETEVWCDFGR